MREFIGYFSLKKGEKLGWIARAKRGWSRFMFHRNMDVVNKTKPTGSVAIKSDPEKAKKQYKEFFIDTGKDFKGTMFHADYVCPRIDMKGKPIFDDEYLIKEGKEYKVKGDVESIFRDMEDPIKKVITEVRDASAPAKND